MISMRLVAAIAALSALAVLGAAACSSSGKSADPTPVQTFKITPAAGGAATKPPSAATAAVTPTVAVTTAATAAASPAATTGATPAATSSGGGGTKLVLVASNLQWDKTALSAPAGAISIEIDNQDAGQPHNIHIYKGTDVNGEDKGMTQLSVGPSKDTLDVTLDKGEYYYQCDVHPTTMTGKLTVS